MNGFCLVTVNSCVCVGEWVCVFKERQEEKLNKENKKFLGGCPKDFFFLKG